MVNLILRLMGKLHLEPKILNIAKNEIHNQYLDCSKAKSLLNWQKKYTLEEALQETINWYRDYLQD